MKIWNLIWLNLNWDCSFLISIFSWCLSIPNLLELVVFVDGCSDTSRNLFQSKFSLLNQGLWVILHLINVFFEFFNELLNLSAHVFLSVVGEPADVFTSNFFSNGIFHSCVVSLVLHVEAIFVENVVPQVMLSDVLVECCSHFFHLNFNKKLRQAFS